MKTTTLKTAINTVLAKSVTLPILECIKIENNNLTVTDLDTTLIIKNIGIEGAFCVAAKQYLNVLAFCETFTASLMDNKVYFESGKDVFSYPTELVSDFPDPTNSKLSFDSIGIINTIDLVKIKSAAKFTGSDELRPSMTNVAITKGLIAATDAHKMYFEKHEIALGEVLTDDILINKKTCKLLDLFGVPVELLTTNKTHLKFETDQFIIIQKIVNERYLDITSVIPTDLPLSCKVSKKPLSDGIKKALTCANKVTALIKFHINGALTLSARDVDFETEFTTTIKSENGGGTIDIGFNGKFLQAVLAEIPGEIISFTMSAPNRAAIFNGNILLMPVKLDYIY